MTSTEVDLGCLGLLQRLLVKTDGTVTDMLAAAFLEPIALVALDLDVGPSREPIAELDLPIGAIVMRRRIVLRGARTGRAYAYAESAIAADALQPALRAELIAGKVPLGHLWQSHRLETWKERPVVSAHSAGPIASHLGVEPETLVVDRTYRTFTGSRAVFLVREWFPARYTSDPPG